MDITADALFKVYGPIGLIIFGLALFIWKWLLPTMAKRDEEYRNVLTSALDDARKERDTMRQLREKEVDRFLESLRYRDSEFRAVADAISERRSRQR